MRPMLRVKLQNHAKEESYNAIVDSGADYCLFPLHLADKLDLRLADPMPVSGIIGFGPGDGCDVPFWPLVLEIAPGFSITTVVGFSEALDDKDFGILGQLGFFSKVGEVRFDYKAGLFGLSPAEDCP
jgi:hypothetical protein